jgi:hypothetical protein
VVFDRSASHRNLPIVARSRGLWEDALARQQRVLSGNGESDLPRVHREIAVAQAARVLPRNAPTIDPSASVRMEYRAFSAGSISAKVRSDPSGMDHGFVLMGIVFS